MQITYSMNTKRNVPRISVISLAVLLLLPLHGTKYTADYFKSESIQMRSCVCVIKVSSIHSAIQWIRDVFNRTFNMSKNLRESTWESVDDFSMIDLWLYDQKCHSSNGYSFGEIQSNVPYIELDELITSGPYYGVRESMALGEYPRTSFLPTDKQACVRLYIAGSCVILEMDEGFFMSLHIIWFPIWFKARGHKYSIPSNRLDFQFSIELFVARPKSGVIRFRICICNIQRRIKANNAVTVLSAAL